MNKNNIMYFLLGIFLVILTSATTVNIMTVKPATPKQFIVKTFTGKANSTDIGVFVKDQMTQGWVLKSIVGANDGQDFSTWVVVMEKY